MAQRCVRGRPQDLRHTHRECCGGCDLLHCRIGIGLNVNQTVFRSDAPNPVSMAMLLGAGDSLSDALARLGEALRPRLADVGSAEGRAALHAGFPRPSVAWRRQTLSPSGDAPTDFVSAGDRHGGSRRIHHSDRR